MYPVTYEVEYVEQRSRLSTFFRLILAIPWFIVQIFWGIVAIVCVVIAWFAIVFTGRYPEGLYNGVSMALRFGTRMNGFALLMTDAFPPFGGEENPEYPVRLKIGPPLAEYSRVKTLFRIILIIPIVIVLYFVQLVSRAISVLAWLVIVVTGKLPRGLFDVMRFTLAYEARASAYHLLVTETYPPFSPDDEAPATSAAPPTAPPLAG
jgi:hypothetical protein